MDVGIGRLVAGQHLHEPAAAQVIDDIPFGAMSASQWSGRDILRVSVSNWSTDSEDVKQSIEALRRAVGS